MASHEHQILPHHARKGRPRRFQAFVEDAADDQSNDVGIYVSTDGRRAHKDKARATKKQRLDPAELNDPFKDWNPVADDEGGDGLEDGDDTAARPGVVVDTDALGKRKRYLSSVSGFSLSLRLLFL